MVEMVELLAILKRNNNNTLVIADELCKGTEDKSSNIIITYMLEILSKNHSSFITASHYHNLINLQSVKNLINDNDNHTKLLSIKHIKITYDAINDMLVYDRILLDGHGEMFYGLQIAKYLMKDNNFNNRTSEILNEYDNINNNKISKYNNNLYINECYLCNSKNNLETHHIIFQKDFDNNGINNNKFYIHKNNLSNLVILCNKCHDLIDNNTIIINGWLETSNGRILDYSYNNNIKSNKKYNDTIINFIKNIKLECNNESKLARCKIKEKLNIKISTNTINLIWNNKY
jgi:DNA mismatch repair protein MutS